MTCMERLKALDLFRLKERIRDLIAVHNYLMGGYREDSAGVCCRRKRGNRHKLKHEKL